LGHLLPMSPVYTAEEGSFRALLERGSLKTE
jgi:hypothetical protein